MPNNNKAALVVAYATYSHGSIVDDFFLLPELKKSDKNYLQRFLKAQFNDPDTISDPIYMVQKFCASKKILIGWIGNASKFRKNVPSFKNFQGSEKILFGYILPDDIKFNHLDMLSYPSFSLASEKLAQIRGSNHHTVRYIKSEYEIDMHEISKLFSSFNSVDKVTSLGLEASQNAEEKASPGESEKNEDSSDAHLGNGKERSTDSDSSDNEEKLNSNHQDNSGEQFPKIWAPIVYSRSYEDDYNFVNLPCDISDEERLLIRNHANATFRSSKEMRKQSRFSCLKTESLTLVGLSCLLKDSNSERMLDLQQREVQSFFGFISRTPTGVPSLNEEYYKVLGQAVIDIWKNKRIITEKTEYSAELECSSNPANNNSQQLNFDTNRCFIFGEKLGDISGIWNEAFIADLSTSLCLNYPEDSLDKLSDGVLINVVPMNRLPQDQELLFSQLSEKLEVADIDSKNFNQDNVKTTPENRHNTLIGRVKGLNWWNP